jgi:hypothetical protein
MEIKIGELMQRQNQWQQKKLNPHVQSKVNSISKTYG